MAVVKETFGWWKSSWGAFFIFIVPIFLLENLSSPIVWISFGFFIAFGIFLIREDILNWANRRKIKIGRKGAIVIIDGKKRFSINKNKINIFKRKNAYYLFGNMFIIESLLIFVLALFAVFRYLSSTQTTNDPYFLWKFNLGLVLGIGGSSMFWTRFMCFRIIFEYKNCPFNILIPNKYSKLFDLK